MQIRAKDLDSGAFLDLCDRVVAMTAPLGGLVIVNDRVDLALLSGASGVHLGQDDLPPLAARSLLGREAIIGQSTHTMEQVELGVAEPVSYVAVGPVFGTATKETGYAAVGPGLVRQAAARAADRPVVAIGGITLETLRVVVEAGASGVAVISDLVASPDPAARVARYLHELDQLGPAEAEPR